jgi:hypothetical protein
MSRSTTPPRSTLRDAMPAIEKVRPRHTTIAVLTTAALLALAPSPAYADEIRDQQWHLSTAARYVPAAMVSAAG